MARVVLLLLSLLHLGQATWFDCKVGDWKPWGECSATCGGGTKTRARVIVELPQNGGAMCPALKETMVCNTEGCPVDCEVGDWNPWGECSATCGDGTKTRAREVVEEPQNGGATCPALEETMVCNTEGCPGLGESTSSATTTTGLDPLLALLICLFLLCCKGCNNSCTR